MITAASQAKIEVRPVRRKCDDVVDLFPFCAYEREGHAR